MKRHSKPRTLPIGSVSSGTMRDEDLIPAFISAVEDLRLSRADRKALNTIKREWNVQPREDEAQTDPADLTSDLFNLLENYTPDYCYFGANEGDGADYGVWPVSELFTDTHQGSYDGFVFRLPENTSPYEFEHPDLQNIVSERIEKSFTHALAVNDHGNATLYRRSGNRWVEVWAIV